jgi:hypothetical protein
MAGLALAVVAWGEERYDLAVATTMGLTTLSLMHIVAALEAREPTGTIFSRYRIANPAADLRHRLADELAVRDLPARPIVFCGARQARRPTHREASNGSGSRRDVDGHPGALVDEWTANSVTARQDPEIASEVVRP